MEHNIMDSFELTVVAMSLVFVILAGLMILIQLTAKIVQLMSAPDTKAVASGISQSPQTSRQPNSELRRVAILTALAQAAGDEPNKHFQIEKVERIK